MTNPEQATIDARIVEAAQQQQWVSQLTAELTEYSGAERVIGKPARNSALRLSLSCRTYT